MKIELKDTEVDGIYGIGDYYIWLDEEGSLRDCVYYTSIEEAKRDMDDYFDKMSEAVGRYWSTRCPQ